MAFEEVDELAGVADGEVVDVADAVSFEHLRQVDLLPGGDGVEGSDLVQRGSTFGRWTEFVGIDLCVADFRRLAVSVRPGTRAVIR